MAKSKRKTIELEICRLLAARLAGAGYTYRADPEVNIFTRRDGQSSWSFSFHLWGSGPYHFIDSVWVSYDAHFAVLRDLLARTAEADDSAAFGGPSDHVSNYWAEQNSRTIASLSDVPEFTNDFLSALSRATEQFLVPHSDAKEVANRCTLFYTKWPRSMGPINTAFYLIAHGIQQSDRPAIQLGIDRIDQRIDFCRTDGERAFALMIRKAAMVDLAGQ